MGILKNPRHEKFAREYVKTGIGARLRLSTPNKA
jgi:hypothetical protein